MGTEELSRELMIQISEDDFKILGYLSEKLDMSISEVLRSLIPKIPKFKISDTPERETGPLKIVKDFDKTRLSEILNEMIAKRIAKTLAVEIKTQVIIGDQIRETLTGTTEKRLLRWSHPARIDDRTRFATPKAKEICQILYGYIPERKE